MVAAAIWFLIGAAGDFLLYHFTPISRLTGRKRDSAREALKLPQLALPVVVGIYLAWKALPPDLPAAGHIYGVNGIWLFFPGFSLIAIFVIFGIWTLFARPAPVPPPML